jgi:hypothetical protein
MNDSSDSDHILPLLDYSRQQKPNPGSEEALKQGCLCPVMDNHYGEGIQLQDETLFYVTQGCPLHGAINAVKPKER